ncbi:serine hydrolase domain-containing protein [Methylobacterium sp. E-045]|uniref:serine hydrolase domain-containing protein n=1 Tax=Methylobacterium sp. E-045 TaxID=2836575 RepID=UPI001FB915B7|nr:serine hydrolase domain-containing protein [Methylobacterium sp. E-045]MCJ2131478.1 beta-lactamase family protein [Methylobacterium sp. E-045]
MADPNTSTFSPQPQIDALMIEFMENYGVPGGALSFRRGGTLLYEAGYGFADQNLNVVTTTSLFRIASDTKAITAAAIFLLMERGKLALNSTVFDTNGLLSQFSGFGSPSGWVPLITVHELLTHTSGGWPNDANDPMFQKPELSTDELIIWALQTYPLQNPPGSSYAYSNFGYCVLGRIIEEITGQTYEAFVQDNVLSPIGITDMMIGAIAPQPNEVHYFMPDGQDQNEPYSFNITRMAAHGGWIASAGDQAQFMAGLFGALDDEGSSVILTRSSLELLLSCTSASIASPSGAYGCGLAFNNGGNAWHTGSLPGTTSIQVHTGTGMTWGAVLNIRNEDNDNALATALDNMLWAMARTVSSWNVDG